MHEASPAPGGSRPAVVAQLVWGSLLAAVGVYYTLVAIFVRTHPAGEPLALTTLRTTFTVLASGLSLVAWALYRRVSEAASTVDPQRLLASYVVCWALVEAIAVFGLVSAMVTRDASAGGGLFIWSVVLLVVLRPRKDHFA
jgi:F0F1-type ATP synthase membrane subunit c/vacuolar-type H+-ATPase subunit K